MGALYRGFSTANYMNTKHGFTLSDIAVVKRDLLNHIFTRVGSRRKMPNFGTTIPDLVFEPMDSQTLDAIQDQLLLVFNYDPRVTLIDMNLIPLPDYNTVVASAVLLYVELDMQDRFDINLQFSTSAS